MKPDRVIIGVDNKRAVKDMEEIYSSFMLSHDRLILMDTVSAEMTKYAANCFLATKISFINEIARLCDATEADINEVRKGITSDRRIGHHFLYPGPGYGGSCFPKDVKALIYKANQLGLDFKIVSATEEVNKKQKYYMYEKLKDHFKDIFGT